MSEITRKEVWVDGIKYVPETSSSTEGIKVDNKDWEILSFRGTTNENNGLFTLDKIDGLYYYDGWKERLIDGISLDDMLAPITPMNIHSVKRNSDGKVFTVGENIVQGCITSIEQDKKWGLGIKISCDNGGCNVDILGAKKLITNTEFPFEDKKLLSINDIVELWELPAMSEEVRNWYKSSPLFQRIIQKAKENLSK